MISLQSPIVRLNILNLVVSEYVKAFGVVDNLIFDIIEKGILAEQLLKKITILYLDANSNLVASIALEIDWKTHKLNAASNGKSLLEFDDSLPILSQLDKATTILINHTVKLREALNVKWITCSFEYIDEITYNPSLRAQYNEKLGLSASTGEYKLQRGFVDKKVFVIDKFNELIVTIEY